MYFKLNQTFTSLKKSSLPLLFILPVLCFAQKTNLVWLDDLPIQTFSEGLRPVKAKKNYESDTLRVNGVRFLRGIGAQTPCVIAFNIHKKALSFHAKIGNDDKGNPSLSLSYFVLGDGKVLFEKRNMKMGDSPVSIDVSLKGIKQLGLLVLDTVGGINNKRTYTNWIDAQVVMLGNEKIEYVENSGKKYIQTPKNPAFPRINSPKIFGVRPGSPFLYNIVASGVRPIFYSAIDLPDGLSLNKETGQITGVLKEKLKHSVILTAENRKGKSSIELEIQVGDAISLTPPLGWNGWNAWEQKIDKEKVIASANAMVHFKLKDFGWQYINLDDSWQGYRDSVTLSLQPNEKFPDIKGMFDYIHSLGLKTGIYSTPYISSYAGYVGASSDYPKGGETHEKIMVNRPSFSHIGPYKFEKQDAKLMAYWGVDFLKYDWRIDVASTIRMSEALRESGRDIILSLSNNAPFEKAADWAKWAQMFRTGPDIKDSWTSLYHTSFSIDKWAPFSGPGHWADPDMMIIGDVSIGPILHPTRLTPDEQYSHVSIFSLLSSPMLIGCPLERLDPFTLNLLNNIEVLDINQDPLGKPARFVGMENGVQLWLKELKDGTFALGMFNMANYGENPASYFRWGNEKNLPFTLNLVKWGLKGLWKIRDVWKQKEIGIFTSTFKTIIPHHGVKLIKLSKISP
jgi:alpha-galactosidase